MIGTQKDEIIGIHIVLYRIKTRLLDQGLAKAETFATYDALGILPTHLQRSKGEQLRAVRLLGGCLALVTTASESERKTVSLGETIAHHFGAKQSHAKL